MLSLPMALELVSIPASAAMISLGSGVGVEDLQTEYDYFVNSWALIGLKDYPEGTRISPSGELWLSGQRRLQLTFTSRHVPLRWGVRKTLLKGYWPVVRYAFRLPGGIRYEVALFAAPLVSDLRDYAWPEQTENFINFLHLEVTNEGTEPQTAVWGLRFASAEGRQEVKLTPRSGGFVTEEGDVWLWSESGEEVQVSPAGARLEARADVAAGETKSITFKVPFAPLSAEEWRLDRSGDYATARRRTVEFWEGLLARGTRLHLPEAKAEQTYKASLIYNFIGRDRAVVKAGEGFYDGLFLRDGAYQVYSLEVAGFLDEARESLESFLTAQKENGQFETQAGQLDAHGYGLWALWQYYDLARDEAWLRRVYPAIRRGVAWLQQARRTDSDPASPFFGLLPNAVADGENLWDGKYHIVGYDFWSLRGLACALQSARALGEADDTAAWEAEYADYFHCVEAALARTNLAFFPPSFEGAGTHWGNLEMLHPTPLFAPDDPRVTATLAEVRRGFVEGTIRWSPDQMRAIHPYMSTFVTNTHLRRGDYAEAVEGFYAYLLHSTATQGFPEGVFYDRRFAWGDTVPHLWAAGQYVILLRNMLVREEGEELHLTSAVPLGWLAPGQALQVEEAPTRFGPVSLEVQARPGELHLRLVPPRRNPPARIVWHVPPAFHITSVAAVPPDPATLGPDRHSVVLPPDTESVTLRARRSLTARIPPFQERTVPYETALAELLEPVKGLVSLPLEPPLEESACRLLDLSRVANTDPFTSPFGALNPGRYLFTGLTPGVQVVGGIPFRILDPATNGGRGLVVLQGANASASFPKHVEIPVGLAAKRVFFLGNVGGWKPEDPGADGKGLVAEYVIRYADGQTQRVPLRSGVTLDDWAMPPAATETFVGLRGEPWHLSVLGVEVQPKVITAIRLEDQGTPTAPLLAAVTCEIREGN